MPIEKSSGAVVFRKEKDGIKYILIHYELGHWGFPRGLIEKGESLEETAKREIEEEIGIEDIQFVSGFKEWIKFFYKFEGKNIMKIATFLLGETKTKEIKLSFEHNDYAWLGYKDALDELTFKNSKDILKKANSFLKKQKLL